MSSIERPEIVNALRVGHDEILRLRRKIELLEPKAHAYDTLAQIARLTVQETQQGYGEDPAWRIKSIVERLVAEREAEKEQPHD